MPQSGRNYIPRPDADFAAWAAHYGPAVRAWWEAHGLNTDDLKPLLEALDRWNEAFPAHVSAQQRAEAARQAKDAARAALERQIRPVTGFVQSFPGTTDAERAELGITLRPAKGSPAPRPATRPLAIVDVGGRLTHRLRLVDESTPTRRARPRGVQRAEVFVAFTPPGEPAPANPGDYRYLGSVTRGETTLTFEPHRGGMQAHYVSRWVSPSGASGPWSETASATVAA